MRSPVVVRGAERVGGQGCGWRGRPRRGRGGSRRARGASRPRRAGRPPTPRRCRRAARRRRARRRPGCAPTGAVVHALPSAQAQRSGSKTSPHGPGPPVVAARGGLPLVARGQAHGRRPDAGGRPRRRTPRASSKVSPVAGWSARCGAARRAPRPASRGGRAPAAKAASCALVTRVAADERRAASVDLALLAGLAEPVAARREDHEVADLGAARALPPCCHARSGRDAVPDRPYRPPPLRSPRGRRRRPGRPWPRGPPYRAPAPPRGRSRS